VRWLNDSQDFARVSKLPPGRSPRPTMPPPAVHRMASNPNDELLSPTTTPPTTEMPSASLSNWPPGRSPVWRTSPHLLVCPKRVWQKAPAQKHLFGVAYLCCRSCRRRFTGECEGESSPITTARGQPLSPAGSEKNLQNQYEIGRIATWQVEKLHHRRSTAAGQGS